MSDAGERSIEDLAAAVQVAEGGEQFVCAITDDRAAFEAVVAALRADWLDVGEVRAVFEAKDIARKLPLQEGTEALWLDLRDEQYALVDPMRTAILPKGGVLLGCDERVHQRLRAEAPHVCSLIVPFARVVVDDAAREQARDALLERLRARYAIDDDTFVATVRAGKLALEPDHALWLVLLGHGELVAKETHGGE